MTDREKLIDLLDHATRIFRFDSWENTDKIADYLLSNGIRLESKQATSNENKRWIPVTERLPEVGDRCLCLVKSFAFPGNKYHSILRYEKLGFIDGCIYTDDVTHWMPLPEPPQEK